MESKVPFKIRTAELSDISFVFNSWLKSYRDSAAVRFVPNHIYYAEHHAVIERIMASPGLRIFIACAEDDEDQIFGYSVGEITQAGLVMHWIYCKFPFRKFGIGSALEACLLSQNPVEGSVMYTHLGKNHENLLKGRKYIYNPYLLRK